MIGLRKWPDPVQFGITSPSAVTYFKSSSFWKQGQKVNLLNKIDQKVKVGTCDVRTAERKYKILNFSNPRSICSALVSRLSAMLASN